MIRRIINLNLRLYKEKRRVLILFMIGIIITVLQFRLVDRSYNDNISIGDIFVTIYGGLKSDYDITSDIFSFILWVTPHLFVLYMINISVINRVRETSMLVLTRAKNKYKWFIAFNITIVIKVIEYYLILFMSTFIVYIAKLGSASFKNISISGLNINANTNQYKIILCIVLINIITFIAFQVFLNNLYYIFVKSNEAVIVGILFILIPMFFKSKLYKITLIDNAMFRRFEIFRDGL